MGQQLLTQTKLTSNTIVWTDSVTICECLKGRRRTPSVNRSRSNSTDEAPASRSTQNKYGDKTPKNVNVDEGVCCGTH